MSKQNKSIKMRTIIATVIAVFMALAKPLAAYPQSSAGRAYTSFSNLRSSGASDDAIYTSAHQCFKTALQQLDASQPGSDAYTEAYEILLSINHYLRSGAFYSSSKKNQNNALVFASAYFDVVTHPAFKGVNFEKDDQYATLAYFAASGIYNRGDKKKAIPYFKAYLETGDPKHRKDVFIALAKACIENGDRAQGNEIMRQAIVSYPSDYNLLSIAINNAVEIGDNASLQEYVGKAISIKPNDPALLNIQGKMYEDMQQYQQALNVYMKLDKMKPNSLQYNKHLALDYYNLGVMSINKAMMEGNSATVKKQRREANEYFNAAAQLLEKVVSSEPASAKYMQALASTYSCLGQTGKLESINSKLSAMGVRGVNQDAVPQMMAYSEASGTSKSSTTPYSASSVPAYYEGNQIASNTNFNSPTPPQPQDDVIKYSVFAKQYVENNIAQWQAKDPYETLAEYQARVTEETRDSKVKELLKSAEAEYIASNTKGLKFNNMTLKPYDAENEVFLAESAYGELVIPVPRANNEAKVFESGWKGMQFKNPEFYISDDRLLLSSLTFVTPTGKSYRYDVDKNLNYTETVVDVSFGKLEDTMFAHADTGKAQTGGKKNVKKVSMTGKTKSDVDTDIPTTKNVNDKTFAVVIANENYSMVAPVPMALNDGEVFAEYCTKALGLPENNVRLYKDASFGTMLRAVRDIKEISDAFAGDIQVMFYYAGHGIPNEATKDAFLLPIDADGMTTDGCYSLKRLYDELGNLNAKSTVVFLDACFSGSNRDGDMLASARGVKLRPKKEEPKGNMIVFSAASDEETAFPYEEKGHGLFTYFLLKKLKESKGNVSLGQLADYVKTNVKQQSVVVNRKAQTPTVSSPAHLASTWQDIHLGGK